MSDDDKVVAFIPKGKDSKTSNRLKSLRATTKTITPIEVELDPIEYGEVAISVLTAEEKDTFCEMESARLELEKLNRILQGRALVATGQILEQETFDENQDRPPAMGDEDAEKLFELQARYKYLSVMFAYMVSERLKCFSSYIGIRQGFKVVRVSWKHKE